MTERYVGWTFVAVQVVLLVAVLAVPTADHWSVGVALQVLSLALVVAGLVVGAGAALRLGRALTATPVPNQAGRLTTDGLYRFCRHPIYSGVLLVILGLVLRSGNLVAVALGVVTALFFNTKAAWEERRLRERYPGYADYAARTGRFLPRLPVGRPVRR